MKINNYKISIGIPVYKSSETISKLLASLKRQITDNFLIEAVYVYADSPVDDSVQVIKKIKWSKLKLNIGNMRKGFAYGVLYFFKKNTSDLLIILNDDIEIRDLNFLSKFVKNLDFKKNVGMVCGNPIPVVPNSFVQKAIVSGYNAYKNIGISIKNGKNVFTCDGKAMGFTKSFINKVKSPNSYGKMGNVDGYLYFECINKGFEYVFAKDSKVYFKMPSTAHDFINWQIRNHSNKPLLIKRFGKIVEKEFKLPFVKYSYYRLIEFVKNPIGSLFIYAIGIWTKIGSNRYSKKFPAKWGLITSTKNI